MSELKNPFGVRNGILFMIEDMTEDDRGNKCKCTCPSCGGKFRANLKDDKKRKHFSHRGDACDEIKAYLDGLYLLLREYLLEGNPLHLPTLGIEFNLYREVTEESIKFIQTYDTDRIDHTELINKKLSLDFNQADIYINAQGYPEAILATKDNHYLAIRIKPPDTVCQKFRVEKYKDYSTVVISIDDMDKLHHLKKQHLFEAIKKNDFSICWIYNATWKSKKNEMEEKRKKYFQNEKEQRSKRQKELQNNANSLNSTSSDSMPNEEKRKIILETKKPLQTMINGYPCIWRVCEKCNKPITHHQTVDGLDTLNAPYLCICIPCAKKTNNIYDIRTEEF